MTANKVRYSPFSYQIFIMQAWDTIQVCCVQIHQLSAKREQKHVRQSTFFLSLWLTLATQTTYCIIAKE
jgi:hypothetical protein